MAHHDELDDILDSALDDFRNADLLLPNQSSSNASPSPNLSAVVGASGETTVGQGLGVALPALTPNRKKTVSMKGNSATKTGKTPFTSKAGADLSDAANKTRLSDTLEELAQQTRQTLERLDTPVDDEAIGDRFVENLVKQFEELGGSQDMQSFMDTVMKQLLSKDILHEPMKEIGERYPKWLEANKLKLSNDDYSRYSRQSELIKQLCLVYETNPDDFPRIVDIMQHMQECGQPPSDIVQEIAPGLEFGADGAPMFSELLQENESGSVQKQTCGLM